MQAGKEAPCIFHVFFNQRICYTGRWWKMLEKGDRSTFRDIRGIAMNEFPSPDPLPERPCWRRPRSALLAVVIALALVFGVVAAMPLLAARGAGSQRAASSGASQANQGTVSTGQNQGPAQGTPTQAPPCPVVANPVSSCLTCPPSTLGAGCPPCPTSVPQRELPCASTEPPITPVKGSTIFFCPGFPVPIVVGPGQVHLRGMVCGKDFHPGEIVRFLATGRGQVMTWLATADSSGNLVSQVPPLLCQLAPLTLTATGNEGSRSNALSLIDSDCQPRL